MQIKPTLFPKIKFTEEGEKLHNEGFQIVPTQAYGTANAYDLYPAIRAPVLIYPGENPTKISLGLHIWLSSPYVVSDVAYAGLILPRSSNPAGLLLCNTVGLIDWDYQGPLMAKFTNVSDNPIVIKPKEAIVQFLIVPSFFAEFNVRPSDTSWPATERSIGRFGSSNAK